MKKYAELLVFLLTMFCISMPIASWYKLNMSGWELFNTAFAWMIYSAIVFIVGFVSINSFWKE